MKRTFFILIIGMVGLLSGCSTQKYKNLVIKNLELQHQVDSLKQVVDSTLKLAQQNEFEAVQQKALYVECQKKSGYK